ncbi:putative chromatin regulator PHD family [Helianthus annuus]|nr:putative chromatin regulator PHD family [Helianthus annuus]
MQVPNSGAESQSSDQSQPIQETDGLKAVGDPADAAAAGGGEVELGNGADLAKKKRGRPPRAQAKSPPVKMSKEEDEDVCFICFDGGSLVLCDRRGCPKAYHPACVKRDEAFFRSKAKWNCGWHICSICQRAAHHMCYTCTYSLCKGCIKKADYVCVRGDKGFCTVCMKTIMLIENGGQEKDEKAQVDFDDKTSWEYLFKVYWIYLKGKLSLTLDELTQAKNPLKEASSTASVISSTNVHNGDNAPKNVSSTCVHNGDNDPKNVLSTCVHNGDNDQKNVSSDVSQNVEAIESKRRKTDEQISIVPHKETTPTKKPRTEERSSAIALKNWATKELLEFVAHMKNGDTSVLTQFDVQELMLEYIKRNSLRDPRKKSQIVCDSRLKILFGKPRVGHFEMLKLLEYHFFIKEDLPKNTIKSIAKQVDPDWNIDNMVTVGKEKKRRNHKKTEERTPQNKLDDYAAIDVHNMNLIYLRRKLMENLIGEGEIFHKKVVGSIVRIRITGSDQKHGMYRLVQVVGTSKTDAPYKIGNKSADVVLEVLNLDKKENMSIDKISNQDLSEDECRRLRQSIKCGLVKRFTVGEIQDKAVSLQSVRLNDLMEAETLRLNNLRDRASEKGHKKSLREYVEKLQLLKTPEERERRLREIPEVHSDPKMNPDYETDDTEEYFNKEHEYMKPKYTGISRKSTSSVKKEKDFSNNVNSRSRKNEEGHSSTKATGRINLKVDVHGPSSSGRPQSKVDYNGSTVTNRSHNSASETSTSPYTMKNALVSNNSELDKMWHYRDPSGKVQGPFCMVQLQKWSTTGYFPQDMKIWTNREDESLLLNDVLKQQLNVKTATDKVSIRVEGLTVRTTNLSSTQKTVNHGKLSGTHGATGQSSVQSWIANGTTNTPSFGKSNESNMTELASPTPVGNDAGTNNVSSVFDIANADLPSPTPKETTTTNHVDEKVQNAVEKEAQNVGGAQLPETSDHVVTTSANMEQAISSSSTPSSQPGDRVATTSANMEQAISSSSTPSSQPGDRVATTSANMEQAISSSSPSSQPGDRVATTSANMEQAISSSSTPTTTTTTTVGSSQGNSNNVFDFVKWPEIPQETISKDMIDVNNSVKADERAGETNASETSHDQRGGSGEHNEGERAEPTTTKSKDPNPELVVQSRTNHKEADDRVVQPATVDTAGPPPPSQPPQSQPLPQPMAVGLDKVRSRQGNVNIYGRPVQELTQVAPHLSTGRGVVIGWDPHQQIYGGERFNKVEDSGYSRNGKPWVSQSSFGSGGNGIGNGGVGGYSRAPPKGQRVCKFYESGRCKKGASCNYWHP